MLSVLWELFFGICCFNKGPQDVPISREFLSLCLIVYGLASFILALPSQPAEIAVLSGLIDTFLLAVLYYFLLYSWRKSERWMQTIIALSGTGIIFSVAAIPLFYLLDYIGPEDPVALWLFLLVAILLVWNVSVMAHIMRHALSSSFAVGVIAALFYIGVSTVSINSLVPQQNIL
jgi:hypothetical protein